MTEPMPEADGEQTLEEMAQAFEEFQRRQMERNRQDPDIRNRILALARDAYVFGCFN